jgi:nucleoside-diphosphate-sugar epimerase
MKVLVTGINGFIGAATARALLASGHQVIGMVRASSCLDRLDEVRQDIQFIQGDLAAIAEAAPAIADVAPESCIHLAWYAEPGKYPHAVENLDALRGTSSLVEVLARAGCSRFIGIGTCFEYDFDRGWLREDSPIRPATLYAASKACMSTLLPKLAEKLQMSAAWLRIFYQYGPQEDRRRLVASVIHAMLAGDEVATTWGEQVRDFLHVDDVGRAIATAAASDLEGVVNIGSGVPVTVREIIETIGRKLNRLELAKFGARPYNPTDPPFIVANNRLLKESTAWRPKFDLDKGLDDTIAWWKSKSV